jgi:hypothetical protein
VSDESQEARSAAQVRPTRSIPSQYEVIEPSGYVAARFPDHVSAVDFANGYNLGLRRGLLAHRKRWWHRGR